MGSSPHQPSLPNSRRSRLLTLTNLTLHQQLLVPLRDGVISTQNGFLTHLGLEVMVGAVLRSSYPSCVAPRRTTWKTERRGVRDHFSQNLAVFPTLGTFATAPSKPQNPKNHPHLDLFDSHLNPVLSFQHQCLFVRTPGWSLLCAPHK